MMLQAPSCLNEYARDPKKPKSLNGFTFLFFFLITISFVSAATRTASQSGSWNSTATWGGASVPVAGDAVVIGGNYTVTVNIATAACSSVALGVSSNGDGTLAFASGSKLTVSGNVTFGTTGGGARDGFLNMTNGGWLCCSQFVDNDGGITYGTGTIEFTGAFNLSSKADFCSYYNLVISSSGTINMTAFIYVYGSITFNSGSLSTGGGSGNGMTVKKDWIVTGGTFATGTGAQCYVTFNGTEDHYISSTTFMYVYFYNTAGTFYLTGDVTIKGQTYFSQSIVYGRYGGNNYKLIYLDGASNTADDDDAFFNGAIRKIGNDIFRFPTGKDGKWAPIEITAPSNTTDEFEAEYFKAGYSSLTPVETPIDHVSALEYWTLNRNVGSSGVEVRLHWKDGTWSVIDNLAALAVARWDGAMWRYHASATSGNATVGNVRTTSNVTSFSPFTFASTSGVTNLLPVELLSFTAQPENRNVVLNWVTLSEANNKSFTIERSSDGVEFEDVLNVEGAGTTYSKQTYKAVDPEPLSGHSYYRLKQTDFDGEFTYSAIVPVDFISKVKFEVFPNPSEGDFNVTLTGHQDEEVLIVVLDNLGREAFSKVFIAESENELFAVDPSGVLSPGIYQVIAASNNSIYKRKIIIK